MSREGSFTITSSISYLRPSARSAQHSKLADSNYPAEIETPNPLGFEPPIETPMIRSMQSTRSCLPPRHCPARLPLVIPQFFLTGALESPHDLALRFCSNPINTSGTRCGITYLMKHLQWDDWPPFDAAFFWGSVCYPQTHSFSLSSSWILCARPLCFLFDSS